MWGSFCPLVHLSIFSGLKGNYLSKNITKMPGRPILYNKNDEYNVYIYKSSPTKCLQNGQKMTVVIPDFGQNLNSIKR